MIVPLPSTEQKTLSPRLPANGSHTSFRQARWQSKLALLSGLSLIVGALIGCDLSPVETATPVSSRPGPAPVSILPTGTFTLATVVSVPSSILPSASAVSSLPAPVGTVPPQVSRSLVDAWGPQVLSQTQHLSTHLTGADRLGLGVQSIAPDGSFLLASANPPLPADGIVFKIMIPKTGCLVEPKLGMANSEYFSRRL